MGQTMTKPRDISAYDMFGYLGASCSFYDNEPETVSGLIRLLPHRPHQIAETVLAIGELLAAGADPNGADPYGFTPALTCLLTAAFYCHTIKDCDPECEAFKKEFMTAKKTIFSLLRGTEGFDPDRCFELQIPLTCLFLVTPKGINVLHLACSYEGNGHIQTCLDDIGCDPNKPSVAGWYPVHYRIGLAGSLPAPSDDVVMDGINLLAAGGGAAFNIDQPGPEGLRATEVRWLMSQDIGSSSGLRLARKIYGMQMGAKKPSWIMSGKNYDENLFAARVAAMNRNRDVYGKGCIYQGGAAGLTA